MQAIEPLAGGGALKLTIATYLTPLGRDLHARGVPPDVRRRPPPAGARDRSPSRG